MHVLSERNAKEILEVSKKRRKRERKREREEEKGVEVREGEFPTRSLNGNSTSVEETRARGNGSSFRRNFPYERV